MKDRREQSVLVIGSGGREHALAWKLSTSPQVSRVYVAPGNVGMPSDFIRWPVSLGNPAEFVSLAKQAVQAKIDLVVVGPDNPLADGITNILRAEGLSVFGPTREAAELEWSKGFAKQLMKDAGVPTADFGVFTDLAAALAFVRQVKWKRGLVVKADGLALGKGVKVCETMDEGLAAVESLFTLGGRLVIEERLGGEEISWLALCDGETCALLEPARDYKRIHDGDHGPNTGGMGAFSPVPGFDGHWPDRIRKEVFEPVLKRMRDLGRPFQGVLFAGLMVDGDDYWVLEFNARFGDPETQVLMPRIEGDFYAWCLAAAQGKLAELARGLNSRDVKFSVTHAVVVVGAAPGYPDAPKKGALVSPIRNTNEGAFSSPAVGSTSGVSSSSSYETVPPIFWAGVSEAPTEGSFSVSGGRVLGAMGVAATLGAARAEAYRHLESVRFSGMQSRSDIAAEVRGRGRSPAIPRPRVIILGSGRGSNFDAIAEAISQGALPIDVQGVWSDRADALMLNKALARGFETQVLAAESGAALNRELLRRLIEVQPDYLVLAGYRRILSTEVIEHFRAPRGYARIVNVHPSLLPAFPGLNSYRQAFQYGAKVAGVTVHLVESAVDSGPICAQHSFSIEEVDSAEEVERRGLAIEHQLYPESLAWIVTERFAVDRLEGGRIRVRKN